jgi:hypothetical protein
LLLMPVPDLARAFFISIGHRPRGSEATFNRSQT